MASSSTTRPGMSANTNPGNGSGKRKKLPHFTPYIAFGVTWILYAMAFNISKLWHIIPATLLSLVVGFVFACLSEKRPSKPEPHVVKERVDDQAAQLDELAEQLRITGGAISDPYVRDYSVSIYQLIEKIADNIDANPIDSKKSRTFTKHYVPTVISIFQRYRNLEKQGISGGNITDSMGAIVDSLDQIEEIFKKQLDDMFDDDALDIKTDLNVLESIMKSDIKQ